MTSSRGSTVFNWKTALLLLVIMLLVYAFGVNLSWLSDQVRQERLINRAVLGTSIAVQAENRGARWFATLFDRTGIMEATYSAIEMEPEDPNSLFADALSPLEKAKKYFGQRIQVVWTMLLQLFIRISTCMLWWQYAALASFPFVIDAMVARKVKAASFRMASPHAFKLSYVTISALPFVFMLLLFAPLVLSPRLMPVMIMTLAVAVWTGISQFAKRA